MKRVSDRCTRETQQEERRKKREGNHDREIKRRFVQAKEGREGGKYIVRKDRKDSAAYRLTF